MQLKNKKFYSFSLGCRANAYELNCINIDLINSGAKLTKKISDADICILNTCSVTNKADAKSKYFINKFRRENKNALIVVMGCFSQTNPEFFTKLKKVIVIGNKYKNKIVNLLNEYKGDSIIKVQKFNEIKEFEKFNNISFLDNTRAFLKIQDGCNFMCSYCIIPFARGKQRSLDHNVIIHEIKSLIKQGYKEIVLTGINTAGYLDESNVDFYHLLLLIDKINEEFRIRISSIEPFQINHKIIDLISNNKKFVQQFHLCLQSGSDNVLKLMNRKYTINEFYSLVKYIRNKNPLASVTTDYIVGFNGESNQDFCDSLKSLKKINFANMHIFPFSVRKFTAASRNKTAIGSKIIKERFKKVFDLNKSIQTTYLKKFINKKVKVLFEKPKNNKVQEGHSEYFFKVYVNTCRPLHGELKQVLITKISNNTVYGKLI